MYVQMVSLGTLVMENFFVAIVSYSYTLMPCSSLPTLMRLKFVTPSVVVVVYTNLVRHMLHAICIRIHVCMHLPILYMYVLSRIITGHLIIILLFDVHARLYLNF